MRQSAEQPTVVIDLDGFDALLAELARRGYRTVGPVVKDGTAIVHGPIETTSDLPVGWHDEQAPASYRLRRSDDEARFSWAVGPQSPKSWLLPPEEVLWRARDEGGGLSYLPMPTLDAPTALVGIRPCELAGITVLDRVLLEGAVADARYARRRRAAFLLVVECGSPSSSCFCTSMGTGPSLGPDADAAADLVLCELAPGSATPRAPDEGGVAAAHRFVVRAASATGRELLGRVPHQPAAPEDLSAREAVLAAARQRIVRRLDTEGLAERLAGEPDHPRWAAVSERCLACGNCTMVCPTCFCSDIDDLSDLSGTLERRARWSSCFELDHSFLHGGPVRSSTASRYRQWATHKLSSWHDQFDSSGCVGCGRCITWCPVGIDLTEEVTAVRSDAASPGALP